MSRRMFGRLAALSPLAGRNIAVDSAKTSALLQMANPPVGLPSTAQALPDPEYQARRRSSQWVRDLIERHRERREIDVIFRDGPFEPDLACLRSCSYAAKMAWQRRRDIAHVEQGKSWQAKLAAIMGWET